LPLGTAEKMRIAFELTGPGEIWLDNVTLHDLLFPLKYYGNSKGEILQIFKLTRAAQSAYEGGHMSDCLQTLDGYWPRFVMQYTSPAAPKMAVVPQPGLTPAPEASTGATQPSAAKTNETEQSAPSIGNRLKKWVPILR
jgi:hypothetical protein